MNMNLPEGHNIKTRAFTFMMKSLLFISPDVLLCKPFSSDIIPVPNKPFFI